MNEGEPARGRRVGAVIGTSYLILGLVDPNLGFWKLPLQWLLKEQLYLSAEDVAIFFSTALIPWYLKPLAGLLSDAVPICGSRRRSYFFLGALASALTSFLVGVMPLSHNAVLVLMLGLHTALMLVNTVTGGVLVEEGHRLNSTGRLTSVRSFAESSAALCVGPIGGWFAGKTLGAPSLISALLSLLLAGVGLLAFREKRELSDGVRHARERCFRSILNLLLQRRIWIAIVLFSWYHIAPGFMTPLFFYQTNVLHFEPHFLGTLDLLTAAAGLGGALIYAWLCKRLASQWLLPLCILAGFIAVISYLGYQSKASAILVEITNGLFGTLAFVALLDLIARCVPEGHGALGYALVFSFGNLASSASDIIGSRWFDSGTKFFDLVWIKAGSFLLLFAVVFFVPRVLIKSGDATLKPD